MAAIPDDSDDPDAALAWLLELRVRARRNPEALAIIDQCLALVARASAARSVAEHAAIGAEVHGLADALAVRYGAPRAAVLQ